MPDTNQPPEHPAAPAQEAHPASAIVLAGGMSRRLGRDKAVEPIGGQPLILRVSDLLGPLADELMVVVANADRGDSLPLDARHRLVLDQYPGGGSLGGIFSGLSECTHQWAIAVACDMPFLHHGLIKHMLSLRDGVDAVVPVVDGRPEPTHAIYSKACLPYIEERLNAGDLKISNFFGQVRVRFLEEPEVSQWDPSLRSFFNINTPEDLEVAHALTAQGI
ncbi:MAG: hypothetical protein BZY88_06500 [SAR202 cluster bacterium Io17-Chloro-G9]|nr:MAG: hypothetical protein BZY88_06500 [SAR202 cluster bacterium Io17-Chloro-G9]